MIELFKEKMASSQDKEWAGLTFAMSGDHTTCIREYDFDINYVIQYMMQQFTIRVRERLLDEKTAKTVTDFEKSIVEIFDDMLKKEELVKYEKVIPPDINLGMSFATDEDHRFGYTGAVLKNITKMFNTNYSLYFPQHPTPAYAISDDNLYIMFIAPVMDDPDLVFEPVNFDTTKTLDNDDLW